MTTGADTTRPLPELEAEQEINFRRYWRAVLQRWWLPAIGLVAGLIIGYLVALGSGKVYKATALIYLGQPFSPNGGTIQSLATNPNIVGEIVHSEEAIDAAATRAGIPVGRLRSEISTQAITGSKTSVKAGQVPLYQIIVTDRAPTRTSEASLSLARQVIDQISGYVDVKIKATENVLTSINRQLVSNQDRINRLNAALRQAQREGIPSLDQLVLVSQVDNAVAQRGTLLVSQSDAQQELALARDVEQPKIVQRPVSVKTTARSTRTSMLVAGIIGLLIGILAALLWDPVSTRIGRNPSQEAA